ncbi:DNA ligase D [Desertivirga arenae]|uniref:DNA ligase D n=1 Tax=Desertivirga arenae TaxID=2810309 RepID=UPI001A97A511|nr:DNA ligase D [Pedobacter sp. SYSU D00823]
MAKTKTKKVDSTAGNEKAESLLGSSNEEIVEGITPHLEKIPESPFPEAIMPMLATLTDKPFDDPDWFYEVKWDGYRALAFVKDREVELKSRNNKSFNEKFYPIHSLLRTWKLNIVLDGEILVLNEKGVSDFGALQNWRSEADGELVFYVFDILYLEGKNLMQLPLRHRLELLKKVLPTDDDRVRISKVFEAKGTEFFEAAGKMGLEGVIAKRADSTYIPDFRSKDWLKIKVHQRQEVVIGGFTKNDGSSKLFSSLLLGVYQQGKFQYVGKVGTGFSGKLQKQMMESFKPFITDVCPFVYEPDYNKPSRFRPNPPHATATWLKPELVCEVSFAEVTSDGVFRHPSFEGMREDKKASDVMREVSTPLNEAVPEVTELQRTMVSAPKPVPKKTLLNPKDETQVRPINGHDLKFTNLSKLYWPDEGISKRHLFNYYYQVAEYILPYLQDRPQSLNRFPNGIKGKSFYQKNVKETAPEWAETFPYITSDGEHKEFLVVTDEASLMWMISLGCIEVNPWFSRTQFPDNPDYCVIDLDPDKNTFDQVIEAANVVKRVLDAINVPSYCKTSGSTGMHIYIPLAAKYTYDQSQLFGRLIANIVHKEIPDYTSVERFIAERKGKMYVDFLQNRPGATIAGPYSLRPKPGATVAMPLHWDEVKPGLQMKDFTIHNAVSRLKTEGDLFRPVLEEGIDLMKAVEKAKSVFGS